MDSIFPYHEVRRLQLNKFSCVRNIHPAQLPIPVNSNVILLSLAHELLAAVENRPYVITFWLIIRILSKIGDYVVERVQVRLRPFCNRWSKPFVKAGVCE